MQGMKPSRYSKTTTPKTSAVPSKIPRVPMISNGGSISKAANKATVSTRKK